MNTLVQITTSDKLLLQGYFSNNSTDIAVLHIHGFEGNFYENHFVHVLAGNLTENNISFLTVNTRGSEKIKDFNTSDGDIKTVGARFELLEDSPKDIDAWIEFLETQGINNIILQGHSLGTMKAVRYMHEGKYKDKIQKLILLAPFDKKALIKNFTKTSIEELLKKAQEEIDNGNGDKIISSDFNSIEVSYKTYVSWYKQDDLGRMFEFCSSEYNFPALKSIQVPTKVIVGSKDEFFHVSDPENPEMAIELLKKNIPNCEAFLIQGANHGYTDKEDLLAKEVVKFIQTN